mmetsp:Transcript_15345/g.36231  ORF Transcript_15345/g.36231 Transcript_15345/m.36231 type:complete len:322 (+) Transcript_15345:1109-2074(+)
MEAGVWRCVPPSGSRVTALCPSWHRCPAAGHVWRDLVLRCPGLSVAFQPRSPAVYCPSFLRPSRINCRLCGLEICQVAQGRQQASRNPHDRAAHSWSGLCPVRLHQLFRVVPGFFRRRSVWNHGCTHVALVWHLPSPRVFRQFLGLSQGGGHVPLPHKFHSPPDPAAAVVPPDPAHPAALRHLALRCRLCRAHCHSGVHMAASVLLHVWVLVFGVCHPGYHGGGGGGGAVLLAAVLRGLPMVVAQLAHRLQHVCLPLGVFSVLLHTARAPRGSGRPSFLHHFCGVHLDRRDGCRRAVRLCLFHGLLLLQPPHLRLCQDRLN